MPARDKRAYLDHSQAIGDHSTSARASVGGSLLLPDMSFLASKILCRPLCVMALLPAACASESEVPGESSETGDPSSAGAESTTGADSCAGSDSASGSSTADSSADDGSTDTTSAEDTTTTSGGCEAGAIAIGPVGSDDAPAGFDTVLDRDASVWGLHLFATAGVSEANLEHSVNLLAQYVDNDEDCVADDPAVLASLTANKATMVIFATESDFESNIDVLEGAFETHGLQDLYDFETHPDGAASGQFDAALEEILHLVTNYGWSQAYPEDFGEADSSMATAMDAARGGHFESIPDAYPAEAWYHYDDTTCDYECMATEYFYWSLTSLLGAQDFGSRCAEIANEWEACTPAQFESMDVLMHELLSGEGYALPTVLPDGSYTP